MLTASFTVKKRAVASQYVLWILQEAGLNSTKGYYIFLSMHANATQR